MAPTVEHQVRLYRESPAVAWGFKLQGGLEYRVPLTVQRVFVGSPADGALHRGDVIVAIDNYDSSQMLYRQAMDLVKRASNSLIVRLRRAQSIKGAPASPASFKPTQQATQQVPYHSQTLDPRVHRKPHSQQPAASRPRSMEYDYYDDYSVSGDGYVLPPASDVDELSGHFQQQSLWGEEQDSQDPDYEQQSVEQLKQLFGKHPQYSSYTLPARRIVSAPHRSFAPHSVQGGNLSRRPAWHKPNVSSNPAPEYLLEPGWAPKSPKGQQASPWVQRSDQQQMSPVRSSQQHVSPVRSSQQSPGRSGHHHAAPPYIQSPPLRQYQAQDEAELTDYSQPWSGMTSPHGNRPMSMYNQPPQHSFDQDADYRSEDGWENDSQHHVQQPVARQPQTYQQPINRGQYQQPQPMNKAQPHHVHKPQPINNNNNSNMINQPAYKNPHPQFNKPQQLVSKPQQRVNKPQQPVNKPQQPVNKPQPVYKQQQQPVNRPVQQQKPAVRPQPTVAKQQPTANNKPHQQHYNNPGNLYSQQNNTPNQYKANKGNIVVTGVTSAKKSFNLAQSDVFRLVSEEQHAQKDESNQKRAFPFANYTDRDESEFADNASKQQATYRAGGTLKQTPLMYELNQQYNVDDAGISDF